MLLVGGLKKTATTTTLAVEINCKTGSMREINIAANADSRCRHKVIKKRDFWRCTAQNMLKLSMQLHDYIDNYLHYTSTENNQLL